MEKVWYGVRVGVGVGAGWRRWMEEEGGEKNWWVGDVHSGGGGIRNKCIRGCAKM